MLLVEPAERLAQTSMRDFNRIFNKAFCTARVDEPIEWMNIAPYPIRRSSAAGRLSFGASRQAEASKQCQTLPISVETPF
jgi:hypothetical protein